MTELVGLSHRRPLSELLVFMFIIKVFKSFVICTFLLLLFHLNFWNHFLSLTGYLLWMSWPINGDLLKDQMHHGRADGTKHLIFFIVLFVIKTQLISLTVACSVSLKRDLDKEGIELLVNKEKNAEGFSNILDNLHKTFIHPSWPLSGLEDDSYNFDFNPSYSNFLNLNSFSCKLYVPYHTCYDDVICTQEGLFVNSYIDNPHYFAEMHFILHECLSILPLPSGYQDNSNISSTDQSRKEICTQRWLSRNGISKQKNLLLTNKPRVTRKCSSEDYPFFLSLALPCKDIC